MAKKKLPTQRTLEHLRKLGWTVGVVERWNPHARIRQDLFGFADLVALHPDNEGVLAIQATSDNGGGVAARVSKVLTIPAAKLWLETGNRIVVIGWKQRSVRRKTATDPGRLQWLPREVEVTLADFEEPVTP